MALRNIGDVMRLVGRYEEADASTAGRSTSAATVGAAGRSA